MIEDLRATHPQVRWQNDVRYVDDGTVVSSAGITAGIDTALHLVERFAGRATAERTAAALHLPPMAGPAVASPRLTPALLSTGVVNGAFSWPKTRVALQMADGIDELAAAAVLDAYPRTFAAVVRSVTPGAAPVVSRHGLLFVPIGAPDNGDDIVIQPDASTDHFFAFDRVLADIANRYDGPTAALTAAQLEYAADRLPHEAPGRRLAPYLLLLAVVAAGAILGAAIGRSRSV